MQTMRLIIVSAVLMFAPWTASAEGACPPGQYPIGGQGVQGCAPIPGANSGASGNSGAPVATGKWETRWGAIAEDTATANKGGDLATGASVAQKSKRAASSLALSRCKDEGGKKCEVRLTYYNQCVAMADPVGARGPGAITVASRAETDTLAKSNALAECQGSGGQQCAIVYSACSLSEFKSFR